jgi:hypothetical protein
MLHHTSIDEPQAQCQVGRPCNNSELSEIYLERMGRIFLLPACCVGEYLRATVANLQGGTDLDSPLPQAPVPRQCCQVSLRGWVCSCGRS